MPNGKNFRVITSLRSDNQYLEWQWTKQKEPLFYLLEWHRDRLVAALKAFDLDANGLGGDTGLERLRDRLYAHLKETYGDASYSFPLKIRVEVIDPNNLLVTSTPVPSVPSTALTPRTLDTIAHRTFSSPTPLIPFRVYICPTLTPRSLFTTHKTTNRSHYDAARALMPSQKPGYVPPALTREESTFFDGNRKGVSNAPKEEILLINQDMTEKPVVMEGSITTPFFFRGGVWLTPDDGGHAGVTRRWALQNELCELGHVEVDSVKVGEVIVLSNGVIGFGLGRVERLPA